VAHDYALAIEISARLARLLIDSTQYAAGALWIERGEVILARIGPSPLLEAQLLEARAGLMATRSNYEKAIPLLRQALSRKEQVLGAEHLATAETLTMLSRMLWPREELPDALNYAQRALTLVEKAYGSDHPEVATALLRIGGVNRLMDRHGEERAHAERALAIYLKVLGPDHPDTAAARWNLATALEFIGDLRGALDQYRQSLPVMERTYGPENLRVGALIGNIANLQTALGDADAGIAGCQREIEIGRKALPASSPKLFQGWLCLGKALTAKGRWDEAASAYGQAEQLTKLGDHPELWPVLECQARLAVRRGRPAEALSLLERVDKVLPPWFSGDAPEMVSGMILRARALDALGRSREAAVEVQRVLDILAHTQVPNRMELDEARELMAVLRRKGAIR
jgi:eukaryotic-like serine/threonine-protein kinase